MDLVDKQIGAEAKVKMSVSGGKLMLTASDEMKGMGIDVSVSVDTDYFLDELAKLIPGTFDDMVIGLAKSALKGL